MSVVCVAGEYRIGVKYNDEHVPKSPRIVQIDPQCEDAKRVTIHGLRDRGLEVSGQRGHRPVLVSPCC